jgi:hypothetical protein
VSREAEILLAIDEFAAALARFRALLVALMPPAAVNGAGSEGADDFAERHLIDPVSGQTRFAIPQDTLREGRPGSPTPAPWRARATARHP